MFWTCLSTAIGIACAAWAMNRLSRGQTDADLVERSRQVLELTGQVESLGEDLKKFRLDRIESSEADESSIATRDKKIKRLEAELIVAREHVAKRDADAETNSRAFDNLTGELRRTQSKLEQLIVEHEAELAKLNAENTRLRSALVAGEALLIEQRGLVVHKERRIEELWEVLNEVSLLAQKPFLSSPNLPKDLAGETVSMQPITLLPRNVHSP